MQMVIFQSRKTEQVQDAMMMDTRANFAVELELDESIK